MPIERGQREDGAHDQQETLERIKVPFVHPGHLVTAARHYLPALALQHLLIVSVDTDALVVALDLEGCARLAVPHNAVRLPLPAGRVVLQDKVLLLAVWRIGPAALNDQHDDRQAGIGDLSSFHVFIESPS